MRLNVLCHKNTLQTINIESRHVAFQFHQHRPINDRFNLFTIGQSDLTSVATIGAWGLESMCVNWISLRIIANLRSLSRGLGGH